MARGQNGHDRGTQREPTQHPAQEPSWEAEATLEPRISSPDEEAERGTQAALRSGALNVAGLDPSLAGSGERLRMPGELSTPGTPHRLERDAGAGPATHEEIIWQAVRASNAAWLSGRPQEAGRLFHRDVVMVAPDLISKVVGRSAAVDSFAAFTQRAKVHAFEEREHVVTVLPPHTGAAAVVTYRFAIKYEMDGTVHDEQGQEFLVLTPSAEGWQVVWRTQVPLPADKRP